MCRLDSHGIRSNTVKGGISGNQNEPDDALELRGAKRDTCEYSASEADRLRSCYEYHDAKGPFKRASWSTGRRNVIFDSGCDVAFSDLPFSGVARRASHYLDVQVFTAFAAPGARFGMIRLSAELMLGDVATADIPDSSLNIILAQGVLPCNDLPAPGIESGRLHLQRLASWNVGNAYCRPELSLHAMQQIDFAWLRRPRSERRTREDRRRLCEAAELHAEHVDVLDSCAFMVSRRNHAKA